MSVQLIQQYHNKVERIIRYGGSRKETAVREPFKELLNHYARQRNLELIAELDYRTRHGRTVYPDGTLKDALRQDWGYWESKDSDDNLDVEIAKKFADGYPANNILFEDTQTAVLYQAGDEVARVPFLDAAALDAVLTRFVSYESREVREFREAIENFARDVPELAEHLRRHIQEQYDGNAAFQKAAKGFLELCQEAINPGMEMADVREMMVQHVLTEDIFITVFAEPQFHRENVIAHELGEVVGTFYVGPVRRQIDARIETYTRVIKARAAQIYNHQEKQKFLKVLYETFYKAYNPKAADRLGIVYTPNEIVRFMIEAVDHLCFQHFGKTLGDRGVEILDPAAGTGTFETELIEYLPAHQLEYKYRHEIHCNEVAILPYYIANLNIEYTYKQKMGVYVPFENILFVDTLDNMGFQTQYVRQLGLFGLTDENLERIQRQNKREISVIIGNPPYNANQKNENENNKNREYPEIDKRIKDTYIKNSAAHKTKLYDMYTRFYRWASDRLGHDGIIAFVSNRSFLDARGFDGFRKLVAEEFSHVYIVDLGGDVRKNPKLSGPKHNVFAIQTGVALAFMVRKQGEDEQPCRILYTRRPEMEESHEKLRFLASNSFSTLKFEMIRPSKHYNWLEIANETDFDSLIPLVTGGGTKLGKSDKKEEKTVFNLFSFGVVTNRDEWVYDISPKGLETKIRFLIDTYESERLRFFNQDFEDKDMNPDIKWTQDLKKFLRQNKQLSFDRNAIRYVEYRPYLKRLLYFHNDLNWSGYQMPQMFPRANSENLLIAVNMGNKPFNVLAADKAVDLHFNGDSLCISLYRYDNQGNRVDNITDWALAQFRAHYQPHLSFRAVPGEESHSPALSNTSGIPRSADFARNDMVAGESPISKRDIFHYVYAVLHHPAYRQKYELNLKREFPRIPFYADFWQWAAWGEQLLHLHLHYETIEPYPLLRTDVDETPGVSENPRGLRQPAYKARLKANLTQDTIELDTLTTLSGVPPAAWQYKLGNRSAIEWVLDRYKERPPKDPTIREQFNTYRFRDYKEDVIELLGRVTAVSLQTISIIAQMPDES